MYYFQASCSALIHSTRAQRDGNGSRSSDDHHRDVQSRLDKVVVTGGAGFIGSHLVDRLLEDGAHRVIVLDNLQRGRREHLASLGEDSRLTLVVGDVRDYDTVRELLRGASLVFHLAAIGATDPADSGAPEALAGNVLGTIQVLRAASMHGVRRVVFTSSHEVYGEPIGLPVDEGNPLLSVSVEGAAKVACEALCRAFRKQLGLDVAILRLATVYGQRDPDSPISHWIHTAEAGEELEIHAEEVVDLVWVGQVVEALVRAGNLGGPLPPINVASGTGTPLLSMARRIARIARNSSRITMLPRGSSQDRQFIASIDRMREILKVEPLTDPLLHLEELVGPRLTNGVGV
jgi:UDP-glucose 4-epimerase